MLRSTVDSAAGTKAPEPFNPKFLLVLVAYFGGWIGVMILSLAVLAGVAGMDVDTPTVQLPVSILAVLGGLLAGLIYSLRLQAHVYPDRDRRSRLLRAAPSFAVWLTIGIVWITSLIR